MTTKKKASKKATKISTDVLDHRLSRRTFVKASSATAGTALVAGTLLKANPAAALNDAGVADDLLPTDDIRFTACLSCHSKCGIRVRIRTNTILKIDGNPWHPNNAETFNLDGSSLRLRFDDPLSAGLSARGTICPKGESGVQVMNNPHRIMKPLKRVGARGAGKWTEISWDTALTEIADRIRAEYTGGGAGTFIEGKSALGTIANQVVFSPGRLQHGQKEFTDRAWKMGFGTANFRHDHTSICETTHHVAGKFSTEQTKDHLKPDILNAKYILWFGTNPLEANFPTQTLAKRVSISKNGANGTKHVIIDPRHSRSCKFAHRWLPVKVGTDAALAMGIARRLIEANNHDSLYLAAANNQACLALAPVQLNPTDATYLVVVKAPSADDEMLYYIAGGSYNIVDAATGTTTVLDRGATAAAQTGKIELDGTETSAVTAASAGLDANEVGNSVIDLGGGVYAAPVFQLYKTRILSHSMNWYAVETGIGADIISAVADEFAAAGRQAVATAYRGAVKHTNGMATMQAIVCLNHLMGNYDFKGGNCGNTGGHLHEMGGSKPGQLALDQQAVSKRSPSGPQITRVKSFFDSTVATATGEDFNFPTSRPWFPFAYNGNYQEILPSIENGYPYRVTALFSYWNNIPYSAPGGKINYLRILADESVLPLHVNFDIEMSEMAAMADYILPDGSYFERWGTPHGAPTLLSKYSTFRSPVVGYYATKLGGPNNETYWDAVKNRRLSQWDYTINWATENGPFTLEDITTELMRRVAGGDLNSFPSFGDSAYYTDSAAMIADGVSPSMRNTLHSAWDWYWNALVNIAIEAGAAPGDPVAIEEMICKIVERGGWFQDTSDGAGTSINEYLGDKVASQMKLGASGKALHFFFEYAYPATHPDKPAKRYLDPFARRYYDPLPNLQPPIDSKGKSVQDGSDFPYSMVTYKAIYHSQGRTDSLPALNILEPENFLEINSADARALGLFQGDLVKISSASNTTGIRGRIKVTERIRPGVVAISHSRGRWDNSCRQWVKNGVTQPIDKYRGKGLSCNPVLRIDPVLGNVSLQEPIGGSASYYDTKVKIEKVLA